MNEITKLVESLITLKKDLFLIVKEEIDYIIDNNIKDTFKIEKTLDKMLDCCYNEESILYYYKLCDYYEKIDKESAKFYRKELKKFLD